MGQITDNRILVDDAEGTVYDDLSGGAAGTADTEIFKYLTQSQGYYSTTTRDGLLHDAGTAQDWSGNVFYIWFNSGVAGLLDSKALGGITVRFCGATVTDYFEVFVDGADTYSGGWKMLVVDIDEARRLATAVSPLQGAVGGTAPATNAIRYVGVTTITAATMPRMVDNTWVDAIWRLPVGEPGIIVGGHNSAVSPEVPYEWSDVLFAADVADVNKAWGTAVEKDGVITLNTPVQFGSQDSPDNGNHDFEDTNKVIAWESNIVLDSFYGFTIRGDTINTQRFVAGVKTGLVGSQGWTVLAADDGPRWFLEATDPNIDQVDILGSSLIHSSVLDIDHINNEVRTTLLIDGQRLWHSRVASPRSGATFFGNTIINATPATFDESPILGSPEDVAYIWTADPDKIQSCGFLYFAGHAINILEAGTFGFAGNTFDALWLNGTSPDGNGGTEAALYNAAGAVILNLSGGGSTPTFTDKQSPGTTINNNISVTLTNMQPATEIRVYLAEDFTSPIDTTEVDTGVEETGSPSEYTFSAAAGTIVDIVVFHLDYILPPNNRIKNFTVPNTDTSFPITQVIDRNKT